MMVFDFVQVHLSACVSFYARIYVNICACMCMSQFFLICFFCVCVSLGDVYVSAFRYLRQ